MKTNEYGLVPGRAVKNFDVYKAGQLCGFEPRFVDKLVASGVWKPTDAADAAEAGKARKEKMVEDAHDDEVFLVGVESGTIQIPQNWREAHHTKRKSWAKAIKPDVDGDIDLPAADEIIAAAVKDQEEPAGE